MMMMTFPVILMVRTVWTAVILPIALMWSRTWWLGYMLKTVLAISLTKVPLEISLRVPIIWTLIVKMLRMRLILMTSLTKISEKKRNRANLMVLKSMMKYRKMALMMMRRRQILMSHGPSLVMMQHVVLMDQDGASLGVGTQSVPGVSW